MPYKYGDIRIIFYVPNESDLEGARADLYYKLVDKLRDEIDYLLEQQCTNDLTYKIED